MRPRNGKRSIWPGTTVRALALAAMAALAAGSARAAEVVCLGASGTQGYGLASNEAYPAQLEAMLRAKGINVAVANAGVSGDTTAGMLARFDGAVDGSTRVLVLQVGTNDARDRYKPEEIKANVDAIRASAAARHIKVIDAQRFIRALPDSARLGDKFHHPNAEGDRMVAAALLPLVIAALRK